MAHTLLVCCFTWQLVLGEVTFDLTLQHFNPSLRSALYNTVVSKKNEYDTVIEYLYRYQLDEGLELPSTHSQTGHDQSRHVSSMESGMFYIQC